MSRGTALVPTAASNESRLSMDGDDGDDGDAHGRIDARRFPGWGPSGRWFKSSRPDLARIRLDRAGSPGLASWLPGGEGGASRRVGQGSERSAIDYGHLRFFVPRAGGRGELVQPLELLCAELELVGGRVLLDRETRLVPGIGAMSWPLGEQPGQGHLCRGGVRLGCDGLHLIDEAEVALEVLAGEARVGLAPIVVGELLGRGICAGEEAVAEQWRVSRPTC